NPTEAFLATSERSFIDSILVEKARKCVIEGNGPIVIGVDPAYKGEFSKDYTAIINRQGRRAYDLKVYHGYDTMQVTGLIVDRINKINPDKIFVDSVGIGVGIVDRLRELGYGSLVMPVNSASKAINDNRYSNKRAEIWGLMKEWLEDVPCQIPDDDMLHDEICSQGCENPDSKNRLVMQKKSELLKSPDRADALAFTFAYPVHRNSDYDRIYTGLSTSVAGLI
ncbi:MAG TPA: hypothetical protein VNU45_08060, partial [Rummeliibacillus sp.]|nr:hypothetical protein [Rummeliibacillus sp.]